MSGIAVFTIAVLLAVSPGCGLFAERPGDSAASPLVRFAEPDGWWRINAPRTWSAARIELDGVRTPLPNWSRTPALEKTPQRDAGSTGVTYEFSEDESCPQCDNARRAKIAVTAAPQTDPAALAAKTADALRLSGDVRDIEVSGGSCGESRCARVTYLTPEVHVQADFISAPHQSRTYELRATAPIARWNSLEAMINESVASFAAGPRS